MPIFFVGAGGGKFKAPEKPVKEVIYNSIVDSAEGLFCSIIDNKNCVKFYQEKEYEFPTVEKNVKRKKINLVKNNFLKIFWEIFANEIFSLN